MDRDARAAGFSLVEMLVERIVAGIVGRQQLVEMVIGIDPVVGEPRRVDDRDAAGIVARVFALEQHRAVRLLGLEAGQPAALYTSSPLLYFKNTAPNMPKGLGTSHQLPTNR